MKDIGGIYKFLLILSTIIRDFKDKCINLRQTKSLKVVYDMDCLPYSTDNGICIDTFIEVYLTDSKIFLLTFDIIFFEDRILVFYKFSDGTQEIILLEGEKEFVNLSDFKLQVQAYVQEILSFFDKELKKEERIGG